MACVSEGETEYSCVPKIVGRLGHVVVHNTCLYGCPTDWERTFKGEVLPQVQTAALKQPDKILVVVDREKRPECCPELAAKASKILADGLRAVNLVANVAVVVSDRTFEVVVMADYELVDSLDIFRQSVIEQLGASLDGKNPVSLVREMIKPGSKYNKRSHGAKLASKMKLEDETVLARSRSLRKLIKELTNE